jgi:ferredoxin
VRKKRQTDRKSKLQKTARKRLKAEILGILNVNRFFITGSININKRTCRGLECRLCINACPTNALFWKAGEIEIVKELCIYCGACVLNCIVDNCIEITRKRHDGTIERFSSPMSYLLLQQKQNTSRRVKEVQKAFPNTEEYLKWIKTKHNRSHKSK